MEMFAQLLDSLIKLSPVVGLLLAAIVYLYRENKELKKDNKDLNNFVKEESVKNAKILESVANTLAKVIDNSNDNSESLKEYIEKLFLRYK